MCLKLCLISTSDVLQNYQYFLSLDPFMLWRPISGQRWDTTEYSTEGRQHWNLHETRNSRGGVHGKYRDLLVIVEGAFIISSFLPNWIAEIILFLCQ